jgi:hypothetical protein
MAMSKNTNGYYELGKNCAVFAFGKAPFLGSAAGQATSSCVGMSVSDIGKGYVVVTQSGQVFGFGSAKNHGTLESAHLKNAVAGISLVPGALGYIVVLTSGAIRCFGDAKSFGAPHLPNGTAIGVAVTPDGLGYWVVTSSGAVFCFGDAQFHGSGYGIVPKGKAVGFATD